MYKLASRVKTLHSAAVAVTVSTCIICAPAANALEQLPQYPIGVGTVYDAFFSPDPGLMLYLYSLNLTFPTVRDGSGNFPIGLSHFNLAANAEAVRPIYVWDTYFLGARPITWLSLPVAYFNGEIGLQPPAAPAGTSTGNSNWMLGDMSVAQGLSWHFGPDWAAQVSLEVFLPSGPYSTSRTFNFGANITTFYPNAGVTYWNHGTNDTFSLKIQDLISTENPATHYQNGNAIELEGGAGIGLGRFGLNEHLGLDVVGLALMQTESDTSNGVTVQDSKSQLFAIGPQLRYNFEHGGLALKWQHEFDARNLPQGERFWAQAALPLFTHKPLEEPASLKD